MNSCRKFSTINVDKRLLRLTNYYMYSGEKSLNLPH